MTIISGFNYCLGEKKVLIESLIGENYPEKAIEELVKEGGLKYFYESSFSPLQLACKAVLGFRSKWNYVESDIDTVIYTTLSLFDKTYSDPKEISRFLVETGLEKTKFIGVFGHGCANYHVALELAMSLINSSKATNILIVTADIAGPRPTRIIEPNMAIVSDGAGCVLVSNGLKLGDAYELGPISVKYDAKLALADETVSRTEYFGHVASGVISAVSDTLKQASMKPSNVDRVLVNNYRIPVITMLATICGFKESQLYLDSVAEHAHCFSSDPIIGLSSLGKQPDRSQAILILSTGAESWASTLLYSSL